MRLHPVAVGICFISAVQVWAAPVAPIPITITQPDGTTVDARARGDEYVNWTETTDGYTIVKRGRWWYYARLDAANTLVATNFAVGSAKIDT